MSLNLLEKTELWIHHIRLDHANLTLLADTVGEVLGLPKGSILVVDVREEHVTLDLLSDTVSQENIIGKQPQILDRLGKLPGVSLADDAYLHSNGILGLICLQPEHPEELLATTNRMAEEIRGNVARRAIVFPTGFELRQGLIEDTNTPYLKDLLQERGYRVTVGDIIDDTLESMEYHLSEALSRGFGLILTTGGVGAEEKDKTVEGILLHDPAAETPYVVKFQQGTGRHAKDGVRIAVGQLGPSRMVSLPGPNDEVRAAAPVLLEGLALGLSNRELAGRIAGVLAKKWTEKGLATGHGGHGPQHHKH